MTRNVSRRTGVVDRTGDFGRREFLGAQNAEHRVRLGLANLVCITDDNEDVDFGFGYPAGQRLEPLLCRRMTVALHIDGDLCIKPWLCRGEELAVIEPRITNVFL